MSSLVAPYPGIRPFRSDEAAIYFGRERLIDHAMEHLARNHVVTIVGPSASGKSSLIRAGLLPRVDAINGSSHLSQGRILAIRPGNEPFRNLIDAVAEFGPPAEPSRDPNLAHGRWLAQFKQSLERSDTGCFLVVDQLEEIFRLGWNSSSVEESVEESAAFVSALTEISNLALPSVHLVLSLRSDFIGDCGRFIGLTELVNSSLILMPPLSLEERLAAIIKPLEIVGGQVDREFAEQLVAECNEQYPDDLVLMQHVLARMWVRARDVQPERPVLTRSGYEAMGGLNHALDLHAEEVLSALSDDEQRIAPKIFKCLTEGSSGGLLRSRPDTLEHIARVLGVGIDQILRVTQPFHEAGLLVPSTDVMVLSHEAVIRNWRRLQNWAKEETEASQMYARVLRSAQLYSQGMSGLLRSPELTQVLNWVEWENPSAAWAERYGGDFDLVMEYLRNSTESADEERRQANETGTDREAPHGVFICYRRDDSVGEALLIAEAFGKRFGPQRIFIDIDSIASGSDFEDVLRATLRSCEVILVLIGIHWLTISDEEGRRRLNNSGDYVRREVRDAMSAGKKVIPVLLGRAAMPKEDELPPDIIRLVKLQNFVLKHESFRRDLDELMKRVSEFVKPLESGSRVRQGLIRALQWTRLALRH